MDSRLLVSGISEFTAQKRLEEEGQNVLPHSGAKPVGRLILEVLTEPMVLLLSVCGILYSLIGEPGEALMLLVSLVLMVLITLVQSFRSESALGKLRELAAPRALVVRDGETKRIPGSQVVRGDLILLNEGDRIPADGMLTEGDALLVDESLLTGESAAVAKDQAHSKLFGGTVVVQGHGAMVVERTGQASELGRIGVSLMPVGMEGTTLQQEVRRLVRTVFVIAVFVSSVLAFVYGHQRHDLSGGLLLGLSLAMAILPNEIPAVLTIFFAMASARMSRFGVISRNPAAIENLGSVSVLCADKTGTLTLNQMSVDTIWTQSEEWRRPEQSQFSELPEAVHEVMEYAVLASRTDTVEPMELAVHSLANLTLKQTEHLHPEWISVREYPIRQRFMMSQAWKGLQSEKHVIGAKGAPEAVLPLCSLKAGELDAIQAKVRALADSGLRIIAVSKAHLPDSNLPEQQEQIVFEFVGLLGLKDPLRSEARKFVEECERLGVRVVMMTGDHPATALAIARELGLESGAHAIGGVELDQLSDADLKELLPKVRVFSRVKPEQKLRIVKSYQALGEQVAMTGDGVNDAPALKRANVGIAMGARGTDVAREAADLVLVRDDFGSILAAIKLGREMRENLRDAFRYILSIHLPVIGLSILPVLLNLPLILLPVHIAFLHIWVEPVSSVAFEGETKRGGNLGVRAAPLFDSRVLGETLFRGGRILAALLVVYVFAWYRGKGEWDTRGLTFTTLLFSNLGLLLLPVVRKSERKPVWIGIGLATLLSHFVMLKIPVARNLLKVNPLHPVDILVCVLFGVIFSMAPIRAIFKKA
ncbi:MAG: cation-translocating P-type ATPase [Bdellovibrionales bacterium]|nr:cation-translocating P-type ATPase [Bdellovibrionales bacterium]